MKQALETINKDFREKKFSMYDLLGYSFLIGVIIKTLSLL